MVWDGRTVARLRFIGPHLGSAAKKMTLNGSDRPCFYREKSGRVVGATRSPHLLLMPTTRAWSGQK